MTHMKKETTGILVLGGEKECSHEATLELVKDWSGMCTDCGLVYFDIYRISQGLDWKDQRQSFEYLNNVKSHLLTLNNTPEIKQILIGVERYT